MLLGVRLKELRKRKGLTQDELARKVHLTKSAISYYENNLRIPTVPNLHELAGALGVSYDFLMGNDKLATIDEGDDLFYLSEEEYDFIVIVRNYDKIYNKLIENPKRLIELMQKYL